MTYVATPASQRTPARRGCPEAGRSPREIRARRTATRLQVEAVRRLVDRHLEPRRHLTAHELPLLADVCPDAAFSVDREDRVLGRARVLSRPGVQRGRDDRR